MKPIRLVMKNFGPYREEVIDFANFEETPLFLISGKTGSGKTTIFDGMCYALYGETTGGLREAQDMRSNFAEGSSPTSVSFIFDHLGKHYEVTREPKQILAKKKGDGVTEKGAKVSFSALDDAGEPLNQLTKINEVAQAIDDLLHLNAKQFTQIILLPQGEFRRFLNASSNEKEIVLRRLFGTDFFHQVAERLKNEKKADSKRLAEADNELSWLFKQVNFDDEFVTQASEVEPIAERLALITSQNAKYLRQEKQLAEQVAVLEATRQRLSNEAAQAEQLIEKFDQQASLTAELEELDTQLVEINRLKEQVLYWEWLEKQQGSLRQFVKETDSLEQSQQEQASLVEALTQLMQELTTATKVVTKLANQEEAITTYQEELATIQRFLPKVLELEKVQSQYQTTKQQLDQLSQSIEERLTQQTSLAEQEQTNQSRLLSEPEQLKTLAHYESQKVNLQQQAKEWQTYEQMFTTYEQLVRRFSETEQQVLAQTTATKTAKKDYQQKKSQAASLQIARLSLDLIPGEACPVCGSQEHPAPQHDVSWSVEAITSAEQAAEEAEVNYLTQEKQLASLQELQQHLALQQDQQVSELEASWQQLMSTEIAEDFLSDLGSEIKNQQQVVLKQLDQTNLLLEEVEVELSKLSALKVTQEQLLAQLAQLKAEISEQQMQQQVFVVELTKLEGQETQLVKEVPSDWQTRDYVQQQASLQKQVTEWQESYQQAQQTQQRLKEQHVRVETQQLQQLGMLEKASEQLIAIQEELLLKVKQSTFDKTVAELLEDETELVALESTKEMLETYEQTKHKHTILLEQLASELANKTYPAIESLHQQQQDNQLSLANQQSLVTLAQQARRHNEVIQKDLDSQHQQLKAEWERLAELTMLSDVANGEGRYKLSFERYVLQVYFLETLKLANQKLKKLTNHRYSFELDESLGTYSKDTGLELNIYDDNVGATRSVSTLSGGESFVAALSLSLALGEVMQAQAGGIRIETLFIDEGFGSLDEDSLEMAIESLELVESKGRMIGIISHVKELKERIPQQIQVKANGSGESKIYYQLQEG